MYNSEWCYVTELQKKWLYWTIEQVSFFIIWIKKIKQNQNSLSIYGVSLVTGGAKAKFNLHELIFRRLFICDVLSKIGRFFLEEF